METISVGGENYVKASSLARELGYTADYVGQLCRSGAVKAQMVGRSWYVHEPSLREHKKSRYRSTAAKSKTELGKALTSAASTSSVSLADQPNYLSKHSARYESDESALWPETPEKESVISVKEQKREETDNAIDDSVEVPEVTKDTHVVPLKRSRERILPQQPTKASSDPLESIQVTFKPKSKPVSPKPKPPMLRPAHALALASLAGFAIALGFMSLESELIVEESQLSATYQFDFKNTLQIIDLP